MAIHLILSPGMNVEELRRKAAEGLAPRHAMVVLGERLGATIHSPNPDHDRPTVLDKVRARLTGFPVCWAMARRLAGELGPDDVVFCQGEDVGFPIAATLGSRPYPPRIIVFGHNLTPPRRRLAARLYRIPERVRAMEVCCSEQARYLRERWRFPESDIHLLLEHIDNRFFTPGPPREGKKRPAIVGVGLEKRDYRTLARACGDLDVDIRISGFSHYARRVSKSIPDPMPPNMTRGYYSWPDLVQLYRDADVVVVPVFPSRYAAGVNNLMEAMLCRRPVVATRSPGLSDYLEPEDGLRLVDPFDHEGIRRTVLHLLEHPREASEMAGHGYQYASVHYDFDRAVDRLDRVIRSVALGARVTSGLVTVRNQPDFSPISSPATVTSG